MRRREIHSPRADPWLARPCRAQYPCVRTQSSVCGYLLGPVCMDTPVCGHACMRIPQYVHTSQKAVSAPVSVEPAVSMRRPGSAPTLESRAPCAGANACTLQRSTVISHDSGTITTFSTLPRANELLRVPQPVFPDRTGMGSIPAKRFLRLPRWRRYFIVPKLTKSSRFSSSMQNQVGVYSDTSPRASPVARDVFFPLLRRCVGTDPAASNPRISLHPSLVRSAHP